jgi:hypothetical protein
MAFILTRQMLTAGKPAHTPLRLYWQPPFATNAQNCIINSASHKTNGFCPLLCGEMQNLSAILLPLLQTAADENITQVLAKLAPQNHNSHSR